MTDNIQVGRVVPRQVDQAEANHYKNEKKLTEEEMSKIVDKLVNQQATSTVTGKTFDLPSVEKQEIDSSFKYNEDKYLKDALEHIRGTYKQHYVSEEDVQLVDLWIAKGTMITTGCDLAEKYLSRYGLKEGYNKTDILKAIHYLVLVLYATDKKKG